MTIIEMGLGLGLGLRLGLRGHNGIRGDKRFKGRGGYSMETSYHFIHQNSKKICWLSIFHKYIATVRS